MSKKESEKFDDEYKRPKGPRGPRMILPKEEVAKKIEISKEVDQLGAFDINDRSYAKKYYEPSKKKMPSKKKVLIDWLTDHVFIRIAGFGLAFWFGFIASLAIVDSGIDIFSFFFMGLAVVFFVGAVLHERRLYQSGRYP